MAGLFENFLGYLKLNDDDYDDDDYMEDFEEDTRREKEDRQASSRTRRGEHSEHVNADVYDRKSVRKQPQGRGMKQETYDEEGNLSARRERVAQRERVEKNSKVVPMRSAPRGLEVRIVKPTSFEDSQEVCNILLEKRAAVVNLEGFDADEAQRIMDFISGCIYAINGKLHRISKYIFIFSPDNVDISGDYLDLLPEDSANALTINRGF